MVGTTRSRVSFFMNRFRKLRFINCDVGDNLHGHSSLLSVVLDDDSGTIVPAKTKRHGVRVSKDLEPPSTPGGPPDNERAKRPPLRALNHAGNERRRSPK
jgi:CRP/FNR family cyclic AMP-dependent transcriptional regulator